MILALKDRFPELSLQRWRCYLGFPGPCFTGLVQYLPPAHCSGASKSLP